MTLGKVADDMDAERARELVLDQIRRTDLTADTPACARAESSLRSIPRCAVRNCCACVGPRLTGKPGR
ncbi:protein of unknown function [Paraburkholderia dioscoreae]|uniref:Uncharacterized protein n=1 Tax=Paraburkholderia dioscoreae TaxID=2604047 RepID=A0A5Q4ZFE0_9BURK|nr:protein of unknown function [Paraburkholderia dioscoreae]